MTIELLATVTIPGELTLTSFLKALARQSPKAHKKLQEYLVKDLEKRAYVSRYRVWEGRLGSHCIFLTAATQKAIIEDDFKITLLGLEL